MIYYNTSFKISYISYDGDSTQKAKIQFRMYDNKRIKENRKWAKKYQNEYLKNKKQQLDNIDL